MQVISGAGKEFQERGDMYVVLGATGNTGAAAVKALIAKGEKVRAVGRDAAKITRMFGDGAEAFSADVTDTAALTRAFSGAAAVYAMIPPQVNAPDFLARASRISNAITEDDKTT